MKSNQHATLDTWVNLLLQLTPKIHLAIFRSAIRAGSKQSQKQAQSFEVPPIDTSFFVSVLENTSYYYNIYIYIRIIFVK